MKLDFDTLTLNEVCDIEEATGIPIDALAAGDVPKGKVLRAMVWVISRRENPELTLEEAGKIAMSDVDLSDDEAPEGN